MHTSVIIPTFNRAELVCEAVESVLAQNEPAQEILVVDDGSADDTLERLRQFGDRITILHQKNSGISAARNAGIQLVRGEWLAFLDSDDLWKRNKLARQKQMLRQFPKHKICYTDEEWRKNGVWTNPKKVHKKYNGQIYNYCLPRTIISVSSVLIHRSMFDRYGLFDESLPACEDYDLWLRLAAREPFLFVPEKLTIKRDGPWEQLSQQHSLDKYRIQALANMLQSGGLDKEQERLTKIELLQKCRIYASGARKHGRAAETAWAEDIARTVAVG